MLADELQTAWRSHQMATPLEPAMAFQPSGLVLGAGTLLASVDRYGDDRSIHIDGAEARLLTLLAAAYGRVVGPEVLGHIRRAILRWNGGDEASAAVHLALTRLNRLTPIQEAARRLFMADRLMKDGAQPEMILRALAGC
jgi:hypothetical protein